MNILALDDEEIALEGLVSAAKKAEPSASQRKRWSSAKARPVRLRCWISRCGI